MSDADDLRQRLDALSKAAADFIEWVDSTEMDLTILRPWNDLRRLTCDARARLAERDPDTGGA